MQQKFREYFADSSLLFISLIWGSTFIVIKQTVELFEPITFVGLRFSLALAIMMVFCYFRRELFSIPLLKDGIKLGFTLFLVFTFQTLALKYATATEVGFLTGTYVLFVPILSAVFLKKNPHLFSWIGVLLSAAGMLMITVADSINLSGGQILALANAFFIGVQIILTDKYSRKYDAMLLTTVQIGVVAVMSMLYSLMFENPDFSQLKHPFVFWSLLFNATVATVFCFFIQTAMQKYTTPTKAAIMFTMEPISSAFFSFFIGGEVLKLKQYMGAAFIVIAILVAELGTYFRLRRKQP
ncbi:DMT family transporter [Seleniivibrio woodruffii]|uniref:Drug/metabolite transporter (DMT)-like permease n=1 Tax=Seleniivibrio woodruffii TaxID=1078050 RepID=A0A4R1K958_9BACT|nr:DMT family transporter [Seleniivibrio woodruffii]TCK60916.1 drug/metabolite transporter (DMT)-like permease [Seleniivibrio woodruffii]TVZ36546.1 drug/metabolite transporter (DMT)-like permease [Seleniivibrio woodruffii]